ncbi:GNAT family protein [Paucibacter sp. PLA-PC-4]|uniref:GNAT family N-acetyltransferase n=1 Tax=Paucibacter sp. PLA-PC-4 TaxID=2993655 RepID=UPI00224A5636|nr:GNAT family protein [Paucibacter sp. PLA-PC-4]MCX2865462.1 GNAT family protein [Paucibacter sp. PLA-PC-4]
MSTMLQSLSLGWQTDLIFARFDGLVVERADCLVVRTPTNPLFYWGNCIVLPEAPHDADLAHWLNRFDQEVGQHTRESGHVAIGFDTRSPQAALPGWLAAGFEVFGTAQLSLSEPQLREPTKTLGGAFRFALVDLSDPAQRRAAVTLQCESNDSGFEPVNYRQHRERQMARYAAMQAAGLGGWFGIWHGDELVADCGLFRHGALGRFQHVGTHPAWRRRGLCSALIQGVSRHGLAGMGLQRLVMCADPDDVAIGIYESVGFRREGRYWGAQRRPAHDVRLA